MLKKQQSQVEQGRSKWYKSMIEEIDEVSSGWRRRHKKKSSLPLLKRLIRRADIIGIKRKGEKKFVENLESAVEMLPEIHKSRETMKKYLNLQRNVIVYYRTHHKLALPNQYFVIGMMLGAMVGLTFFWKYIYIAWVVTIIIGTAGKVYDKVLEKKGKII